MEFIESAARDEVLGALITSWSAFYLSLSLAAIVATLDSGTQMLEIDS